MPKRGMKRIASLFVLACLASVNADVQKLDIYFAGSKAGENTFDHRKDGTFESKTQIKIGSIEIKSNLTAKLEAGKLVSFSTDTSQGPISSSMTYEKGGLKVIRSKGKPEDIKFDASRWPMIGALHPLISANFLKKFDYNKKTIQAEKALLVENGAVLEIKVKPLPSKTITVEGNAIEARFYTVNVGAVEITYLTDKDANVEGIDIPTQKLRFVKPEWAKAFVDPLAAYPELSQPTFTVKVEKGVKMKMRDGVSLVADIYRPTTEAKVPAVLVRTPYGRENETPNAEFYAKRGYAYVVQDCRGRSDSEGDWDPFVNERKDGYDTVQWVAGQSWSDGKVGMIGASYGGYVQWSAAVEVPPALKCIIPQVSPPDAMHNIPYDFGIPFLYGDLWWAKIVKDKKADLTGVSQKIDKPKALTVLPLSKADDALFGESVPIFDKWLERETIGDWKGFDYQQDIEKVKIPVLHISGWFDGDEIGTQMNYAALRSIGRDNQWLLYGPWTHAFNTTSKLANVDFGSDAILELDSLYLRWFDTWLKGKEVGIGKVSKVRAFVMGANKWVEMRSWPDDAASKGRTLFLSAPGSATLKSGKGTLAVSVPDSQKPTVYTYDPAKDTDFSALTQDDSKASFEVKEKNPESTLLFKGEPLKQATAIAAPFELSLWFSSSAQDTDFYAAIVDVDEAGKIWASVGRPGKIRASYLNGMDKRVALEPGKIYEAKIQLWDSAYEFKKGHRIGVLISSSGFPVFARNLGTVDPVKDATRMVAQKNTVYCDPKHPSKITFRVLWER